MQVFFVVEDGRSRPCERTFGKRDHLHGRQEVTWFRTLLAWVIPHIHIRCHLVFPPEKDGDSRRRLMAVGKSKAKVYVEGETKVTFEDVAGVEEAEEELKEVIEFLRNPQRFQTLGGRSQKGFFSLGLQVPARLVSKGSCR